MPGQLSYYIAASVDGHIAHVDGSFDGLLTEGPHVPAFEADLGRFDTVLMGRRTYEVGLAAGLPEGAPAYPGMHNVVCSRTLEMTPREGVSIVSDAAERVRADKAAGRSLWLCGGADLATSLFEAGLVDELLVKLNPTVFGAGIGLVAPRAGRIDLALTETRVFENGVVLLRYRGS